MSIFFWSFQFEDNKELKLSNIEKDIATINNQLTLDKKVQCLKEVQIASNLDNIYLKQLIEQYQEKVIENRGWEVSVLDFMKMEIVHEEPFLKHTQSKTNKEDSLNKEVLEENKYLSFSSLNSNQYNNSVQMMS